MAIKKENKLKELDYADRLWEMKFFELKKFKDTYGHCDVSTARKNNEYCVLGRWCETQRRLKKFQPHKYNPTRERRLNEIGFLWNPLYETFERRFAELIDFKKKFGHFQVPHSGVGTLNTWITTPKGFRRKAKYKFAVLRKWCVWQLENKRNKFMITERERRFNAIGFPWDPLKELFEKNFKKLQKYYDIHGNSRITRAENRLLHSWCSKLRGLKKGSRKKGILTPERIKKLDTLKFEWEIPKILWRKDSFIVWEKRFSELQKYKIKHGSFDVKKSKNTYLSKWVINQRNYYKYHSKYITPERIKRLNDIGFNWISNSVPKKNRVKEEDLLNDLIRLYKTLHKTPAAKDFKNYGKYRYVTYNKYFGGLANACKLAGIATKRGVKNEK